MIDQTLLKLALSTFPTPTPAAAKWPSRHYARRRNFPNVPTFWAVHIQNLVTNGG